MSDSSSIPYGYCHCGCGKTTEVATRTIKGAGWVKGQPRPYVSRHSFALNRRPRALKDRSSEIAEHKAKWEREHPSIPYGSCCCGCGETTPLARQTHTVEQTVKGQPRRYIQGHYDRRQGPDYFVEDRGYTTPCWVWRHCAGGNGYGQLAHEGKKWLAHRLYYTRYRGPLPDGSDLDHVCVSTPPHLGTTLCVNPDHLEVVTHAENGRRSKAAKLTMALAEEIRRSYAQGGITQTELGKMYGVDPSIVSNVVNYKAWT